MRSSKKFAEIKYGTTELHSMFEWLNQQCIYITPNMLGHTATRVIGHLFHIHPRVTHCTTLCDMLSNHLSIISLDPKDALLLALHTKPHYNQAMDSGMT